MMKKTSDQRPLFLRHLSEELAMPAVEECSQNMQVMRNFSTKLAVDCYVEKPVKTEAAASSATARDNTGRKVVTGSCHMCYFQAETKRRKTRKACCDCSKFDLENVCL
ncbi:uncharacterized protein LOC117182004 [Belonocnema kinseyi]|uniref:uncharacterized protein LOC117182004 n=1 Tax=Belonocnema kinseyi TaxID=2817044 RepID=UPI00143CF8DE|nr:uncharacterized protein LOC117182004 [Belonocnema kinseyi]